MRQRTNQRPSIQSFSLFLAFSINFILCQRAGAQPSQLRVSIPVTVMLRIVRAEDERRWDTDLQTLLADKNAEVRRRVALAAGRIGDERAVPALISLLQKDSDERVRAMAAFGLGEIESANSADALIAALSQRRGPDEQSGPGEIRARAVEALGKIAAPLPKSEETRARPMKDAIVQALEFEAARRSMPDNEVILLGLTAALRARPENAGKAIARFLGYSDPRVRADAANTLARLKLNDGNAQLRKLLIQDPDPIVRANAARVLGATEDKAAFDALLDRALKDADSRARVSAVRALGALKDGRAGKPLLARGESLYSTFRALRLKHVNRPAQITEILEIATALGRVLSKTNDERAVEWLKELGHAPEALIAFARIAPDKFLDYSTSCCRTIRFPLDVPNLGQAQAWADLAPYSNVFILQVLRNELCLPSLDGPNCVRSKEILVPDVMRAYAAFKQEDLSKILRKQFNASDVVVRATAAELLGDLPPDEANTRALIDALPTGLADKDLNDAALAILDALGKQKSTFANDAIKTALDSSDHLIRRRAVALLKENGVGDFSSRIGTVQTRNTTADYERAIGRIGKQVRATVNTSKGSFMIELLPEAAPLTVDNFVMLARKGFFNGQTVPRVVPNFVVQTGDPRGDQNGGPGYSIRCEINEVPYDRGAVGMALSGKDTGGSQWFVTHSPQPHLDGGYTVFGHVTSGMNVVDGIVRGDIIRSITIFEGAPRASKPTALRAMAHRSGKRG